MKLINKLKKNSKGFAHLELIVIVVVVAAVAATGYFVYQHHKKANQSLAGGYQTIAFHNGYKIGACKTYIKFLGGVDRINLQYIKPAGAIGTTYENEVVSSQGGMLRSETFVKGGAWWNNVVAAQSTYASTRLGYKVFVAIEYSNGYYAVQTILNPATLTVSC